MKCKCNFTPPRPYRPENGLYVYFKNKSYFPEFFCNFCKGLITNDMDYIREVISYHSYERWHSMRDNPHRNREEELEYGDKLFYQQYKELLKLTK